MTDISKRELAVMEILWGTNRDLTVSEIVEFSNGSIKINSLYLYINSLLEKGLIAVSGQIQAVRTRARTYKATMTETDYLTKQLLARATPESMKQIILTAMKANIITLDTIEELEELMDAYR